MNIAKLLNVSIEQAKKYTQDKSGFAALVDRVVSMVTWLLISDCPPAPTFCISFAFHFSWVLQPSQEKLIIFFLGGGGWGEGRGAQTRCIIRDGQVAYDVSYKKPYQGGWGGGSISPVWILKRLVLVFINACRLLSALLSLSQFGRGRLCLVVISFYAQSLLFGPCRLPEFTPTSSYKMV